VNGSDSATAANREQEQAQAAAASADMARPAAICPQFSRNASAKPSDEPHCVHDAATPASSPEFRRSPQKNRIVLRLLLAAGGD
jgi:hypothetical protein